MYEFIEFRIRYEGMCILFFWDRIISRMIAKKRKFISMNKMEIREIQARFGDAIKME